MFTQAQQRKYFTRKLGKIYHLLGSIKDPVIEPKILHDIRVAFKHLMALVAMVNYCNEVGYNISIKKLDLLYKLAGKIRNSQVVLLQLEGYHVSCDSLYKEHQSIIEKGSSELCLRKEKFKKEVEKLKNSIQFPQSLPSRKVIDYYSRQKQKLQFILSLPEDIILLHEGRKIIKKMLLPLPVLETGIRNKIMMDVKALNDLQQKIGDLHDAIIASELIKKNQGVSASVLKIVDKNVFLLYAEIRNGFSVN